MNRPPDAPAGEEVAQTDSELLRTVKSMFQYCWACWRAAGLPRDEWQDASQDVFLQLTERVPRERWGEAFAEGENDTKQEFRRAIWTARKRVQRKKAPVAVPEHVEAASAEPEPLSRLEAEEELEREHEALELMLADVTPVQATILRMMADGHEVAEIAVALGMPAATVSRAKYDAVKRLHKLFGGSVA